MKNPEENSQNFRECLQSKKQQIYQFFFEDTIELY